MAIRAIRRGHQRAVNAEGAEPGAAGNPDYAGHVREDFRFRTSPAGCLSFIVGAIKTETMTFAEAVDRARERGVSSLRAAIEDRSSRGKVHVEPALRTKEGALAFAPDGLKLPLRLDFVSERDPDQKYADSVTIRFVEPAYATWEAGMRIELISLAWDGMIFTLSPAKESERWDWLVAWFMRWFDQDDVSKADDDGLFRVVHFVSDPVRVGSDSRFVVDFGSAKIDAMMDLLDRIGEQGYQRCRIGDER